jgi:proteasome alpha subunit
VSARELANAYSQTLHQIFTHEMKPYEVELLVADVGYGENSVEMYRVLYDGVVVDEHNFSVLGGSAERANEVLGREYEAGLSTADALKLGMKVLGTEDEPLTADSLEVALLDRGAPRRAFRRVRNDELTALLA